MQTEASMHSVYKPFRNFLRQFDLTESLHHIWRFANHLSPTNGQPPPLGFVDRPAQAVSLHEQVFPWDLDLLAREIILNAGHTRTRSFARWSDFTRVINFIRQIEDEISRRWSGPENVMRELHRIAHRQFPWQRPPTVTSIIRYQKIFAGKELEAALQAKSGLTTKKFFQLAFAANGHLLKASNLNTATNYSAIGISLEESQRFYANVSAPAKMLRERTLPEQRYDGRWLYSWNPLHATPFVQIDPAFPERCMCPMPTLLLRRNTEGLFYDLVKTPGFDNAFGRAFQSYVGEVLYATLKPPVFTILAEEEYSVGKNRKDGVDWLAMDETANLFIECKAKRLRQEAKFNPNGDELTQAIDAMGSYIVQHYKNILDAIDGHTSWQPNGKPCYALVGTLEEWWIFSPEIVGSLNESVGRQVAGAGLPADIVTKIPFSVASANEMEIGFQIVAQTGINRFFELKTDAEHRDWAFGPFALSEFGKEAKRIRQHLFGSEFLELGRILTTPSPNA